MEVSRVVVRLRAVRASGDNFGMTNTNDATNIERRMRELGEELDGLEADAVDLEVIERRVQELANAWGRGQMARAMKRADTDAPEVDIHSLPWGNRRAQPSWC